MDSNLQKSDNFINNVLKEINIDYKAQPSVIENEEKEDLKKEEKHNENKKIIDMDYVLLLQIAGLCMVVCWGNMSVFLKDILMIALAVAIWIGFHNNFESNKDNKTFKLFSHKNKGQTKFKFIKHDPKNLDVEDLRLMSIHNKKGQQQKII